ncbi:hypothetical protein [Corynebacterium pygosceleis]
MNEASAVVVVQSLKDLDLDMNRCNPTGGGDRTGTPTRRLRSPGPGYGGA